MSKSMQTKNICPYLGLAEDRESRFSYPEKAHLCFATDRAKSITLEHQSAFCFSQEYPSCSRFDGQSPAEVVVPPPRPTVVEPEVQESTRSSSQLPNVLTGFSSLLVVVVLIYSFLWPQIKSDPVISQAQQPAFSPSPTLPATPTPTEMASQSSSTPALVALVETPTAADTPVATATARPGDRIYTLSPEPGDIGWVVSEEQWNHFGDSFLYAGIFEGQVYQAAFQIDLNLIPRGAPIHKASLELTGLRGDRLSEGGAWTLRLLAPEIDEDWRQHGYQEIFNASVLQALSPIMESQDLIEGQTNTFELSPDQIELLETRIIDSENPSVSFRIDGPLVGSDNLFAWDTGYGSESRGAGVTLSLSVGPPPATPPPFDYVVVTSTPTPENVQTAAAIVMQMTADASRIGTATPVSPDVVTATPFPEALVIIPTPIPENEATAQLLALVGTAEALTTGTPTPLPTNAATATPTPSATPSPTYAMITATPTPESVFAAATLSAMATAQAQRNGPPTPLPANWATPFVVTSTPTPPNEATAQFLAALATAQAFTTGTPTATPANMVTATPTPIFVLLDDELPSMTPTPIPASLSVTMPPELIGKIAFKSDRSGDEEIYVINPDGSGLALLSDQWPYDLARQADAYSSDGRFRVFVKDAVIDTGEEDDFGNTTAVQLRVPSLYFYDSFYEVEEQITHFGAGIAYDPAWSPTAEQIALVSNDSGNDEIWVINRDGTDARQLTLNQWEWDKHPSWSPDGTRITFVSNRTGNQQIWVMDRDGGNLYSLSRTGFNDWDPVWIKYPDVPSFKAKP